MFGDRCQQCSRKFSIYTVTSFQMNDRRLHIKKEKLKKGLSVFVLFCCFYWLTARTTKAGPERALILKGVISGQAHLFPKNEADDNYMSRRRSCSRFLTFSRYVFSVVTENASRWLKGQRDHPAKHQRNRTLLGLRVRCAMMHRPVTQSRRTLVVPKLCGQK